MTAIAMKPLLRFGFSRFFSAKSTASPAPRLRTVDGRHIDAETLTVIRDLPPHILKDIGVTDF